MLSKATFSYNYEFDDEETDIKYWIEVELFNYFEPNYGFDIDGKRGVPMNFVEIEEFKVYLGGQVVTDKEVVLRAEKDYQRFHEETACELCAEEFHS